MSNLSKRNHVKHPVTIQWHISISFISIVIHRPLNKHEPEMNGNPLFCKMPTHVAMLSCLSGDPKCPKHNSPLLSPSQFFFSLSLSPLSSRSRYDTNLLEATGLRETSPTLAIHDVKLLLLRFADLQSFSEDTGGGGRESNLRLIPYQLHAILHVLTT